MKGMVHPHDNFKKDRAGPISIDRIRYYWRYDGDECEYIASQMLHPWHADLVWSRLRYFLYWRRCLFEGVCLDTDAGYVWLHVMELLVVDDDPMENHECLLRMREAYGGQDEIVDGILREACYYFEAMHGIEISDTEDLDRQYRTIRICRKLSSDRLDPLSPRDLTFITGYKGKSIDRYAGSAAPIVSAALHEIGRAYADKGILELCGRPMEVQIAMPFKEDVTVPLIAPMNLRCRDPKRSEPFAELVKGLHKTCIMRLAGKQEVLPGSLAKYQRILEGCISAWKEGSLNELARPYRKMESPVAIANRMVMLYEDCILPHGRDGTWPSYRFKARMREYGDIRMPQISLSRPTKNPCPCYSRMTLDEYAGYQSWKEAVLKGESPQSSEGFTWLLVNETLHDDMLDPRSALEVLRACRLASSGHTRTKVESVMADWCIYHDLDADVSELFCDSFRIGAILARALSSDPPRRLSQGILAHLCRNEGGKADVDLVNASISALYRYHGNTLAELFNAGMSRSNIKIFEDCACMPISMVMRSYSDMEDVTRFLKNVCSIVQSVESGDDVQRCPFGFGSRNRDIVRDASFRAIETKRTLKIKSLSEEVKLDMDAVISATEDLVAVTGMMYSGEEEPERNEPTPTEETPSHGDPWEDFASRLSQELLEYISGCLDGRHPDRKSEKAVNEIAMDTVGDIVVEDGQAVEDYIDQLETISKNYLEHQ